jgi:hypothetical protein
MMKPPIEIEIRFMSTWPRSDIVNRSLSNDKTFLFLKSTVAVQQWAEKSLPSERFITHVRR